MPVACIAVKHHAVSVRDKLAADVAHTRNAFRFRYFVIISGFNVMQIRDQMPRTLGGDGNTAVGKLNNAVCARYR